MELGDLEHGARVDQAVLVRSVDRRSRKEGGDFLKLVLGDRSGTVAAVVWDDVETLAPVLVRGAAVRVVGRFEVHDRYGRQISPDSFAAIPREEADMALLVEAPSSPVAELEDRFRQVVGRIDDDAARRLVETVFDPAGRFWPKFRMAPAAKHFHEAYPHGLLDHTLRVAEGVEALAPLFGGVDRAVAVAGALLHDIGKVVTYDEDPISPEMTDLGRLEGHIVLGIEIVRRALDRVGDVPAETAQALRHIVLSHHGKLEYGSPVQPVTREAVLVHHVDDLAARMGSFDRLERGMRPGDRWSAYDRGAGGSAYFAPTRPEGAGGPEATGTPSSGVDGGAVADLAPAAGTIAQSAAMRPPDAADVAAELFAIETAAASVEPSRAA